MAVSMDSMELAAAQWLDRWNRLQRLEIPEAEQEMCNELFKLGEFIERTTKPSELRKLMAILDEVLPQLEQRISKYIHFKTGKA